MITRKMRKRPSGDLPVKGQMKRKSSLQERKKYNMITDKVKLRLNFQGYYYFIYPTDNQECTKINTVKHGYDAMWREVKTIAGNSCCFTKTE